MKDIGPLALAGCTCNPDIYINGKKMAPGERVPLEKGTFTKITVAHDDWCPKRQ